MQPPMNATQTTLKAWTILSIWGFSVMATKIFAIITRVVSYCPNC